MRQTRESVRGDLRPLTERQRQKLLHDVDLGLADVEAGRVLSDEDFKRHFAARLGPIEWT
jgi:hypothetical protein